MGQNTTEWEVFLYVIALLPNLLLDVKFHRERRTILEGYFAIYHIKAPSSSFRFPDDARNPHKTPIRLRRRRRRRPMMALANRLFFIAFLDTEHYKNQPCWWLSGCTSKEQHLAHHPAKSICVVIVM